ncbi:MAG: GNAT family N-acetyltransferase [Legionella sp.]|nr:GNAT family N-acetyltransferase [Legionella sp.]
MLEQDINAVALVHSQAFSRQLSSTKWITCNFHAYPRIMMFVAVNELNQIVGYIQWLQKSGFRTETVIELEQIAVLPVFHGKNIGTTLITTSLKFVKDYLIQHNSILKAVIVTTRADNAAQFLYEKTLGAKANVIIKDLYSHDEVVMISRVF